MRRCKYILGGLVISAGVSWGSSVVTIVNAATETPTSLGMFTVGEMFYASVTGTVNLAPFPFVNVAINPDGSLNGMIHHSDCEGCNFAYDYFLPGSTDYPTVAGGDGVNHFVGGGGNYDIYDANHSPWALEGKRTTDTTDPEVIRFGAMAYSWNQTDWSLLGYGNILVSPVNGPLWGVIVDAQGTSPNNFGMYTVTVHTNMPEPATLWLIGGGLIGFGVWRRKRLTIS